MRITKLYEVTVKYTIQDKVKYTTLAFWASSPKNAEEYAINYIKVKATAKISNHEIVETKELN